MKRLLAALALALPPALLAGSCESDIPPAEEGLRVTGQVSYAGDLHATFARPAVVVSLFTEFPPMSPPRGSLTIEGTSFATPVPFELVGVPSGRYKIVAQLVDLDVAGATGVPVASFPSFCVLFAPVGNIEVTEDEPTEGLNMTLYDPGRDPCLASRADAGPADGGPADAGPADARLVLADAAVADAPPVLDAPAPAADARAADAAGADAGP